mmetsp:Transcript_14353/g.43644  ORF Transcript_14353/g.43644 Transcript_14353/m.43644 type:complete len:291 (-) Transcript_14353:404-1276(-)
MMCTSLTGSPSRVAATVASSTSIATAPLSACEVRAAAAPGCAAEGGAEEMVARSMSCVRRCRPATCTRVPDTGPGPAGPSCSPSVELLSRAYACETRMPWRTVSSPASPRSPPPVTGAPEAPAPARAVRRAAASASTPTPGLGPRSGERAEPATAVAAAADVSKPSSVVRARARSRLSAAPEGACVSAVATRELMATSLGTCWSAVALADTTVTSSSTRSSSKRTRGSTASPCESASRPWHDWRRETRRSAWRLSQLRRSRAISPKRRPDRPCTARARAEGWAAAVLRSP